MTRIPIFLKPVYTIPSKQTAKDRFEKFTARWGQRYPAIMHLRFNAWAKFVSFLEYDAKIRRVTCTTNAIEPGNIRYRQVAQVREHFPSEAIAIECLYLVTPSPDPTGDKRVRWVMKWKPALNAFAITLVVRFEKITHE